MAIRPFEDIYPDIAPSAYVDAAATVIGKVAIGADSSLWPGVVARGDVNSIKIGANTNIQDGSILHVTHKSDYFSGAGLVVGDHVTVGHMVCLHGCTVEDNCLIGMGSLLMDGAVVQAGAMLGAGSLVSPGKVLEGGYLWLGRPAKRIRELTDEEREYLSYSAAHYVALKNRHNPDQNSTT